MCCRVDLNPSEKIVSLQRRCANNLNQAAIRLFVLFLSQTKATLL